MKTEYYYGEDARRWGDGVIAVAILRPEDGRDTGHTSVYETLGAKGQATFTVAHYSPGGGVPFTHRTFPTLGQALAYVGVPPAPALADLRNTVYAFRWANTGGYQYPLQAHEACLLRLQEAEGEGEVECAPAPSPAKEVAGRTCDLCDAPLADPAGPLAARFRPSSDPD